MPRRELPIPNHFQPDRVGRVWDVDYEKRAGEAREWRREHRLTSSAEDEFRTCLLGVDIQNTFCLPGFELFVAGRGGSGAVDDTRRLCAFIYRNLDRITTICSTMDTHYPFQIFHAPFLVGPEGEHPEPLTQVSVEDVRKGRWKVDPEIVRALNLTPDFAQRHIERYADRLEEDEKFSWTIWPFHSMLGSLGHAQVAAFHEAIFFHAIARHSQPDIKVKGDNPLTEHYSILGPEVTEGPGGEAIASRNEELVQFLTRFDRVLVAGQAKSHCVYWTVQDLLDDPLARENRLAERIYLLEDCTSPVVVPDVVDFTEEANEAFQRFAEAGMQLVESDAPMSEWPPPGSR